MDQQEYDLLYEYKKERISHHYK